MKSKPVYRYQYDQYQNDFKNLIQIFEKIESKIHFVSIFKGGVPLGIHLSNTLGHPLHIFQHQTRNILDFIDERNQGWLLSQASLDQLYQSFKLNLNKHLVILDDIYDTGETMKYVYDEISCHIDESQISCYTLFGKENDLGVCYLNETNDRWIVFPWEMR